MISLDKLYIKLINNNTNIPVRGTCNSAGLDLFANENGFINPLSRVMISTGIIVKIPTGYYGRIAPRSGLAFKNGIDVLAGVIDSDYRGEIKVILYNTDKDNRYEYKKDDKIAQLIIEKYYDFEINVVDELDVTRRGDGGFGSTDAI
jgi:dUTP pyrophosphatase